MNISPKGFYEGFLLKSGKRVIQINLPKEHVQSFADGWPTGGEISLEVEAEEPWGTPAHKLIMEERFEYVPAYGAKESNT